LYKSRARSSSKGDNYKNAKIGWAHLKIISKTTKLEKLRFTQKLPDIVQI
jgi:hypothetical protein